MFFWSATTRGESEQLDFINWVLAAFCSGGRGESHWWDWSLSPWYHLPTITTNNYSLKSITGGQSSSPISSKVQLLAPRLYSRLPADEGLARGLPSKLHIANSGVCMCGRASLLRWVIKQRYTGVPGAFWPYHLADFTRLNRISPCNATHSEYQPRLITPQAREHAACTAQPGINIHLSSWYNKTCRHKGLLIKRLHGDPSEQHNEWGVTSTSVHTHTLTALQPH